MPAKPPLRLPVRIVSSPDPALIADVLYLPTGVKADRRPSKDEYNTPLIDE
jgi:hypothetical protein